MTGTSEVVVDVAAGVPFVAVPPDGGARPESPTVLAWHLLDAPRTERAFASALPLQGLDAWRVYFGLPLSDRPARRRRPASRSMRSKPA
ncbi:hypothetical protein [Parafrankia sp. EUN1f]|uniref:hypothetical protein n=1 Tax=Parafrankia sp. EUN1f TaxID=102897 RepID=UPI0001C43DE5|nr:hypothetical protein [Parafrankia sp. EUN1f]EFC85747.1 hypothetical protein FrEUN1fDRAFT_1066 [Parafrankia sp. EUN1f]